MISAIVSAMVFCLTVRQRNAYATERRYTLKPSHPASHSAAGPAPKRYTTLRPSHSAAGPAPRTGTNAACVLGDTDLRGQIASHLKELSERKGLYDAMGRDARGTMSGTDTALYLTDRALGVGACPDKEHLLRSTQRMERALFKWETLRKAQQLIEQHARETLPEILPEKLTDAEQHIICSERFVVDGKYVDNEWTRGLNLSALRYFQCAFANNNDNGVEQAANDVRKVFDIYARMVNLSITYMPMEGILDAKELPAYEEFLALPFERDGRARGFSPATLAAIQALGTSVEAAHAATLSKEDQVEHGG